MYSLCILIINRRILLRTIARFKGNTIACHVKRAGGDWRERTNTHGRSGVDKKRTRIKMQVLNRM